MQTGLSFWTRVLNATRDAWLIVGIACLLLVALEFAYRGQAAVRRLISGTPTMPAAHPYTDSAWYNVYRSEYARSTQLEWQPFVYYRRPPFKGVLINIDSARHRVTTHPEGLPASPFTAFFFGGSTMWGDYQRDAATIPSIVVTRLAAEGIAVRATNFGESGWVMSQGVVELLLQLRSGERPDVVVFYDGINDVAAALQSGQAGIPQNEFNRAAEFRLGRAVRGWEKGYGIQADLRAFGLLIITGAERFQLLQRLVLAVRTPRDLNGFDADELAAQVVAAYTGNIEIVEALAAYYGFKPFYFWQPNPYVSEKRLTEFESTMLSSLRDDPFEASLRSVHRLVNDQIDSAVTPRVGDRFSNLTRLFSAHAGPVWVDRIGHTTEHGAEMIAQVMAQRLRTNLQLD